MILPFEKIDPEVLEALIEEFITRDGTDSGYTGGSLKHRIAEVWQQLRNKEACIVYDEKGKTWNIISSSLLKTKTRVPNKAS